jgi:alpha,alpha-trehalase
MRRKYILLIYFIISLFTVSYPQMTENAPELKRDYIQLYGPLFEDVQLTGTFKDSKTFVDAVPLKDPAVIRRLYDSVKSLPDFDLGQFINANFSVPKEFTESAAPLEKSSLDNHIEELWNHLVREPKEESEYSTLLPLKYPYIVPGGRFREIYYWDSFFTILGLLADNKTQIAENMVHNFAYLIDTYGMIPNGNRVYYLTRSQPPFFSLMVDIISRYKKDYNWGAQFIDQLETEYSFWMSGAAQVKTEGTSAHVVMLNDSSVLNRYYDMDDKPREESYKEDYNLSLKLPDTARPKFYRDLRSAAESGWDFSSRWFADGKNLSTIQTTDILPVDLNCLLYFLEDRLAFFYKQNGNEDQSNVYARRAEQRKVLINKVFWNEEAGYYFDYNWKTRKHTGVYSLAAVYPLYFGIASPEQAREVKDKLQRDFLKAGGLVTTLYATKQQWDFPNGWAPLQWMSIKGLREYGLNDLADEIKSRWLKLNESVYGRTNKMLEKYNVEDVSLFAGGGEYPNQDGFGWTNGIWNALQSGFDKLYLNNNK